MNNDNIDLYKLLFLTGIDIDKEKSSIYISTDGMEITCRLFVTVKSRICPYCHSSKLNFVLSEQR